MNRNLKLNLVYFSATGTTERIVKSLASGLSEELKEYNITMPENRMVSLSFSENNIVIVGVPVYAGRVPEFLANYFNRIRGSNTYAIFIVVYGNREYDDALLELKNIFEENGFIGIAGGAFIGEHSYTSKVATNRPDASDLNIAFKFGMDINEKLKNYDLLLHRLTVKGNYPYRKGMTYEPIMIDTDVKCIDCGACSKFCPMGAIDRSNHRDIVLSKCIRCCRCIKRCPVNAKNINHEEHIEFITAFANKYSMIRKEPELFII